MMMGMVCGSTNLFQWILLLDFIQCGNMSLQLKNQIFFLTGFMEDGEFPIRSPGRPHPRWESQFVAAVRFSMKYTLW